MHILKLLAIVLPTFLMIDLIWLGVLMKDFYSNELGDLARRRDGAFAPRWWPAICVYLLIPTGIVLFVRPLLQGNVGAAQAFGWGVLFGLVVYGVYDLTSLAILEKWSLRMTIADIVWGCVICGITSVVMLFADNWLNK